MKTLPIVLVLALASLVAVDSQALAQDDPLAIPELSKELVQHCVSLKINPLAGYPQQLEHARRAAFVCHDAFAFFEEEITDRKRGYAIRNYLRDASKKMPRSRRGDDDAPNVLDSYSFQDSEIEKLLVVINNFDILFYGKPSKRGAVFRPFLLKTAAVGELDVNFLLKGWTGYQESGSRKLTRSEAAIAYAAFRALDADALMAELKDWGITTPAYTRVVKHWLKLAGEVCAHLDTVAASTAETSPAMASVFSEAASTYKAVAETAVKESAFLKQQDALIARLLKGDTPEASECEVPMLQGYGKLAKETWRSGLMHPLATRARELAETCAKARDWGFHNLVNVLARDEEASTALGFVAIALRKHDEKIAGDLGETVQFELTSQWLRKTYGPSRDGKRRAFVDGGSLSSDNFELHDGAIKVTAMKPMTIAGAEFVLIGGIAKKVRVPDWNCTVKKIGGWVVRGNEIRPRTSRKCKKVGHHFAPAATYYPMLVPKIFAKTVKKGSWYKFLRRGTLAEAAHSHDRTDGGKVHPKAMKYEQVEVAGEPIRKFMLKHKLVDRSVGFSPDRIRYAVPVCVSKKGDACAAFGTDGEPFDAAAPASYKYIF